MKGEKGGDMTEMNYYDLNNLRNLRVYQYSCPGPKCKGETSDLVQVKEQKNGIIYFHCKGCGESFERERKGGRRRDFDFLFPLEKEGGKMTC